jgi:ornithine cyclodeaminase
MWNESFENSDDVVIVRGHEVRSLLRGREQEVLRAVRLAYETYDRGEASLPHSTFLRFPAREENRIIALPAYLGGTFDVAGVKWISSFPGNPAQGLDRASAVVTLNSMASGRPRAILEGSLISATRTAASAVLAAQCLDGAGPPTDVGVIGCGPINFEIVRFFCAVDPRPARVFVHDVAADRARRFADRCAAEIEGLAVEIAAGSAEVLAGARIVSIATNALRPHVATLAPCPPGATILHVSLRDLAVEAILAAVNVVDDIDHVCRANTSVHLAEQRTGGRAFIRGALGDVLTGRVTLGGDEPRPVVFSPFGLGILDVAVARFVLERAMEEGKGQRVDSFFPVPWGAGAASRVVRR